MFITKRHWSIHPSRTDHESSRLNIPGEFQHLKSFQCSQLVTAGLLIHPPKQTWNLKMDPWKRRFLLETIISRFHVNFWGCNISLASFIVCYAMIHFGTGYPRSLPYNFDLFHSKFWRVPLLNWHGTCSPRAQRFKKKSGHAPS